MANTVLLINPSILDFAAYDFFIKPLGLLYLSAILRRAGLTTHLIDALDRHHPAMTARYPVAKTRPDGMGKYYRQALPKPPCLDRVPRRYYRYGMPPELMAELLTDHYQRHRPDAVLVTSMMTYWYPGVAETIALIRRIMPGVPIALGGVYATLMPDHARRVCRPDRLFPGPAVTELLGWLGGLPGVTLNAAPCCGDFTTWPAPDYSPYTRLDYLTVISSVGCPYRCWYCAGPMLQPGLRQLDPDAFVSQLRLLFDRIGPRRDTLNIAFTDDALLTDAQRHFIPIMQRLGAFGLPFRFHTPNGLHARFITPQVARLMFENRFDMIRISYEAADRQVAHQASDGKISDRHFEQAVANLTGAGFPAGRLNAYLLTHLPGQSLDEVEIAARTVHRLGVKIRLCQYSPIPGTALFESACDHYKIDPAEPLMHNNSIITAFDPDITFETFQRFKDHINQLNQSLDSDPDPPNEDDF